MNPSYQRRVKIAEVGADFFVRLLGTGNWVRLAEQLPSDVRVVGNYYERARYQVAPTITLVFETAPPTRCL